MFQKAEESGLVEHGHAERRGFVELRAGFFSGDEVVGFLADRAGDFAAGGLDFFFGGFAGERGQRAGEDEGEAFECGAADALFRGEG